MTIVNHECYISLEIAKLLKEVGFDWECRCYYETSGKLRGKNNGSFYNYNSPLIWQNNGNTDTQLYSAPTLDVAQRWLREVKNISVDISSTCYSHYEYIIRKINQSGRGDSSILALTACRFYTYEEAQEAGIKKALEIV